MCKKKFPNSMDKSVLRHILVTFSSHLKILDCNVLYVLRYWFESLNITHEKTPENNFLCVENNYSIALYYASQDKFDVNLWRFNIYTLVCWELLRWDRKICWKGRFAICVFGSRKMLSDFLIILSRIRLSSLPTYLDM